MGSYTNKAGETRKSFSKELYAANDPAKELVLTYLQGEYPDSGWHINPGKYGQDLLTQPPGPDSTHTGGSCAEVEVKQHWKFSHGITFPYLTLQIPERKMKWIDLDITFWVLRADLGAAVLAHAPTIKEHIKLEVVLNKYVRYGEKFIIIPIQYTKIVILNLDKKEIIP